MDHDHSITEMEHTIEEQMKNHRQSKFHQNFDEDTAAWYASRMQPKLSLEAVRKMSRWILNPDPRGKGPAEFQSACMKVISELHEWPNLMRQYPDPENILKKPDGFTGDKARVDEQALQAEREIATLAQDAAAAYNETIPVLVSPRLTPSSEVTSEIAAITLMSNHSHAEHHLPVRIRLRGRGRGRERSKRTPALHGIRGIHPRRPQAHPSGGRPLPERITGQTPLPTTWKTC